MKPADKGPTTTGGAKQAPLAEVLDKTEHVKDRVEECATELSTVNAKIKEEIVPNSSTPGVVQALDQSAEVESKIQQCAQDLSSVTEVLVEEIGERKHLERALSDTHAELVDSQASLADSRANLVNTQASLFGTQADLLDSQAKEEKARHLALHDQLTGLPNRHLFNDRLHHALAQAQRHGWSLAVIFIDLDKFKNINDTYGHDAGDKVLQTVGQRLQDSVRAMDTVCRQGGDEFLYLMLEVQDSLHIAVRAGKMIHTVSAPCEVHGVQLVVEASVGIAIYPGDGETAELLLKNADTAMYKAKQNNEGYSFFSSNRS